MSERHGRLASVSKALVLDSPFSHATALKVALYHREKSVWGHLRDADLEAFVAYRERLIGYIERFVEDLLVRGQEIASLIAALA